MFIVAGAKRTGTSLMMQMFKEAGFKVLGEKFPAVWEGKNNEKNPEGFYESKFVEEGVNNTTSPFPPRSHKLSVTKIFSHSLYKCDSSYIKKVVLMVRDWREQTQSWNELAYLNEEAPVIYPPGYDWFYEYNSYINDYVKRSYNTLVIKYDDLIENPEDVSIKIGDFIGVGRWDLASNVIKPDLKTVKNVVIEPKDDTQAKLFSFLDSFYEGIATTELSAELNSTRLEWEEIIYKEIASLNDERKSSGLEIVPEDISKEGIDRE